MQQQQHLMQMQPMMAAYYPNNVTTDHIQQYLDENKSLILKIVESQNSGKLNECAENQARLQRNLMYLAAIADSQPQPPPSMHSQFPPGGILQAGGSGHYMQQQQQQQQQMNSQSLMAARSSMVYSQQQQALLGMSSVGTSGLHMLQTEANSSGYADFGRAGETMQGSSGLGRGVGIGMGNKLEIGSNEGGGRGAGGGGGGGGGGEILYLKSAEDDN